MSREIKFRIMYQSPDTDEPNKLLLSKPVPLWEFSGCHNYQVDFTDGSYLMRDEMEFQYCTFEQYTGLNDKNGKEIYEGDSIFFGVWAEKSGIVLFKKGSWIIKDHRGDEYYLYEVKSPEKLVTTHEESEK